MLKEIGADRIQRPGARVVSIKGTKVMEVNESGAAAEAQQTVPTLPTAWIKCSYGRPNSTARCLRGFYEFYGAE